MKLFQLISAILLSLTCAVAYGQERKAKGDDEFVFARYNLRTLHLEPRVDYAQSLGPETSKSSAGFAFSYEGDEDFEDLLQFVSKNIAPETWEDTDARIEQTESAFRIYQTRAIHRDLRKLWNYLEQLAAPKINVYFELHDLPNDVKLSAGDQVSKKTRQALKELIKTGKAKRIWSQRAAGRDGEQLLARTISERVLVTNYHYQERSLTQSLAPIMETLTEGVEVEVALTMAHNKLRFDVWAEELTLLGVENHTVAAKLLQCPKYQRRQLGSRFIAAPGQTLVLSRTSTKKNRQRVLLARISDFKLPKSPLKSLEVRRYPLRSICARTFQRTPPSPPNFPVREPGPAGGGGAGGVLNFDDDDDDEDSLLAEELVESLKTQFHKQSSQFWQLGKTLFVMGPNDFQEQVKKFLEKGIPTIPQKISYEVQILTVPDDAAPDSDILSQKELAALTKAATKRKVINLTGLTGNKSVLRDYTSIHYISNVVSYQRIHKQDPVLVPETNTMNAGLALELTGTPHSSGKGASVTIKLERAHGLALKEVQLGPVKVQMPLAVQMQRLNETCYFGVNSKAQVIEQSGKNGMTNLIILKAKLAQKAPIKKE